MANASECIGIFGGSFDPVHCGHLLVAQAAMEELSLSRLFFVPAAQSPFKPQSAPAPAEERRTLSEEEIAALCDHLTPVLEKTVREALSQTLEMTLHNALMRVRSDLDRSIQPMVRQALERELRADILSQVLKRKGEAPQ